MSESITLELPAGVSDDEARRMYAFSLFRFGKVSLGRAGEIAGVEKEEWLKWISALGHAVVDYGDDWDPQAEIAAFEKTGS